MVFAKRLPNGDENGGETLITPDGKTARSANSQSKWALSSSECLQVYDKTKLESATAAVLRSWSDQFRFVEEQVLENGETTPGLRPPQIGGLHSALGHWKMSDGVATIVMPTGTGKTETMVALTLHERPSRLLVIVPSESDQISGAADLKEDSNVFRIGNVRMLLLYKLFNESSDVGTTRLAKWPPKMKKACVEQAFKSLWRVKSQRL
jgi:hypothetical protein